MRFTRWLAVVFGVGVAVTSLGATGCAGLLGDFTTSDEASDGGVDSSLVADANGTADGTVNTGGDANGADANGPSDGTFADTNSGDAPSSEDAGDSAPGPCGPGEKMCSGTCRSTSNPAFGCDDGDPSCAPCALTHAVAGCTAGACSIASCTPGFNDCNGVASDGCETLGKCPCDSTSCPDGCCDNGGNCQTSGMTTCGVHGASCNECVTGQVCNSAGGCQCDPSCGTCCSNDVCVAESDTTCGNGGGSCTGCASGTTCAQTGTIYQCVCTPGSCNNGCCTIDPGGGIQTATCTTTELPAACGLHGATCAACGSGVGCVAATGQCTCGISSCGTGCCTTDVNGKPECEMQSAQSPSSCGNDGSTCAPCSAANTCTGGACSCPATAKICSNVCTDVQNDAQNCGTCGHSCVDEMCSNGQCVQVTLAVAPTPDGGPSPSVEGLVVASSAVYYTVSEGGSSTGSAQKITLPPVAGCAPNCSSLVVGGLDFPTGIVLGGTATSKTQEIYVGVSSTGTILLDANGVTSTAANNAGPSGYGTGLITDSTNVYYGDNGSGVTSCPLGTDCTSVTTTGSTVATGVAAMFMAVDDGKVLYFSDFGPDVYRCTLPSCVATGLTSLVSNANEASYLHVDATSIFWIDRGTSPFENGTITRSNKATGAAITTYTKSADYAQGITADATNVYWGERDGVYACPIGGCTAAGPTKIGTAQTTQDVDEDTQFVYWGDYGGNVYRVAK
jgi:hypothetical protein